MDIEELKRRVCITIDQWANDPMGSTDNADSAIIGGRVSETQRGEPIDTGADNEGSPGEVIVAGHPEGQRVIRTKSTADRVYLLKEDGMIRQWVTNTSVLESLGYTLADVVEIPDEEMLKYQQAQAIYRVDS